MTYIQKEISIPSKTRGFHIITENILSNLHEIKNIDIGILHVFIKHTSASITINENVDKTVRLDLESHFNKIVPENQPYYLHIMEGADDMPAHIKSSILGSNIQVPISKGKLNLGTWQGIYLCEHRNDGGPRKLVLTIWGE